MFDELHDPNPPAITSRQLAEVAERAAGIRRRRNAITGGVAAVALLAAGTVGVAATNRGDTAPAEVADAPLPTVVAASDDPRAPATTVLDPASLPPAVPVNPDPEDLPPATPVNPDPTADAGSETDTDSDADDADTGSSDTDTVESAGDTGTGADTGESAGDGSPTLDVATAAALRADDPIVAITESGQAVWFPAVDADSSPLVVSTSADRLDFLADGTAVVNVGSNARLVSSSGDVIGELPVGRAATVDPSGSLIAGLDSAGTLVVTEPVGTALGDTEPVAVDEPVVPSAAVTSDRAGAAGIDVMWSNTTGLLVLVTDGDGWGLSRVGSLSIDADLDTVDGAITTVSLTDVSGSDLRFAGIDAAGQIVLHDAGTATLFSVTLSGVATESELDAPARSVWFDGTEAITVAPDGTLTNGTRSGTTTLPGTYLTARR